jgi:hypothetical protein
VRLLPRVNRAGGAAAQWPRQWRDAGGKLQFGILSSFGRSLPARGEGAVSLAGGGERRNVKASDVQESIEAPDLFRGSKGINATINQIIQSEHALWPRQKLLYAAIRFNCRCTCLWVVCF